MNNQITVHPSGCSASGAINSVDMLVELVVQRLALGQDVAAAKYVSRQPIDDLARERVIMDSVARVLSDTGASREIGLQFFRDQIEANKVIQRGLHHRWYAHPDEVPAVGGNLPTQVRPKLDRITGQMLRQFMHLGDVPQLMRGHIEDMLDKRLTAMPRRQLPGLHRTAALFALRSLCSE